MTRTNSTAASPAGGDAGPDLEADDESPIRYETEDDVDYVVIPTVAQREGVYQYRTQSGVSREFVAGEELTDPLDDWEGVPVTLRHPVVVNDGQAEYGLTTHPTARYTAVGEFRDTDRSTDSALKGEVWIPEAELGRYDGDLEDYVDDIDAGGVGEVSSGYAPGAITNDRGTYDGDLYTARQESLRPDHVALLPDEPGNCSVADQCGAGRTNEDGTTADGPVPRVNARPVAADGGEEMESVARVNILSDARTPEYEGAVPASQTENEFLHWSLEDYLDAYVEETGEEYDGDPYSALSSIPEGAAEWIAEHTLLGAPDAETEDNLLMFEVVGPDGQLYEEKLLDILGPGGARATIPEDQRESARDVAEDLLDEAFGGADGRTNASRVRQAWRDLWGAFTGQKRANVGPDDLADGGQSGEVPADSPSSTDTDTDSTTDPDADASTGDEPAESGADSSTTYMEDSDKTEELVEEHGFDAENLPDEGEDCFDRIYEAFAGEGDTESAGAETSTETETETTDEQTETETETETTDSPETPGEGDAEGEMVTVNRDELESLIDERLDEEKNTLERERQEQAIVNSEAPFDAEDLEPMNNDAVARLHEKFVADDADGQSDAATARANYAGMATPTPASRANADDGPSAPVAGVKNTETRTNSGDDE